MTSSAADSQQLPCPFVYLNLTASKSASIQHVRIHSSIVATPNNSLANICPSSCPPKTHHQSVHHGRPVCIPLQLYNDYADYNIGILNAAANLATLSLYCRTLREQRSCNHLANLCILHRYRTVPRFSPCSLFRTGGGVVGGSGSVLRQPLKVPGPMKGAPRTEDDDYLQSITRGTVRYPGLFGMPTGKDTVDFLDALLDHKFEARGQVKLIQLRFELTGNLQSMQALRVADLNPCSNADNRRQRGEAVQFGENLNSECSVNIAQYIDRFAYNGDGGGGFIELYLNYTADGPVDLMRVVPILVRYTDAADADVLPDNHRSDRAKWQLVTRFNPIDTYSERNPKYRPNSAAYSTVDRVQQYKTIRYAKHIELQFRIDPDDQTNPNRMRSPLLVVDMASLNTSSRTADAATVNVSFAITFTKYPANVRRALEISVYVFCAAACAGTVLQTFRYKTRQQREFFDADLFVRAVAFLCGNVAAACFWAVLTVVLVVYVWWCKSANGIVRVALPLDRTAGVGDAMLVIVAVAVPVRLLLVLQHLWQLCCGVNVFFVDWERSRSCCNDYHHQHMHHQRKSSAAVLTDATTRSSSVIGSAAAAAPTSSSQQSAFIDGGGGAGVSAWRTYFVAQQWLRLATCRPFSIVLQTVLVGGTIAMLQQQRRADDGPSTTDHIVHLAECTLAYLCAYGAQRLLEWAVVRRLMHCWSPSSSPSPRRFVDVCSVANVSVFVLRLETFGYYVHGRSPYGFADTDATALLMQLRREREQQHGASSSTMARRGLLLSSDQQTFAFLVPTNLR